MKACINGHAHNGTAVWDMRACVLTPAIKNRFFIFATWNTDGVVFSFIVIFFKIYYF